MTYPYHQPLKVTVTLTSGNPISYKFTPYHWHTEPTWVRLGDKGQADWLTMMSTSQIPSSDWKGISIETSV